MVDRNTQSIANRYDVNYISPVHSFIRLNATCLLLTPALQNHVRLIDYHDVLMTSNFIPLRIITANLVRVYTL